PAGEAGFYDVAGFVEGHHLGEFFYKQRSLGSRTNNAHLPFQNVIELRELIDPRAAQEFAETRDAFIILLGPLGTIEFGVIGHRSELYNTEWLRVLPHPLLGIE